MGRVAIVTDSAADLPADRAAAAGITIVPLEVTFGSERLLAGVDLTVDAFWQRMVAPDSPFPTTAAASPATARYSRLAIAWRHENARVDAAWSRAPAPPRR